MTSLLDDLRTTITGLSLAVPDWIADLDGDPIGIVLLLDDLRGLRKTLAEIEASVEAKAAQAMTKRTMPLPDGRVVTRHSGSKRSGWRHSGILTELWGRAVAGTDGDLEAAGEALVADVVRHAAITYWRGSVGLDLDEYSARERGRRTVQIPGRALDGAA